MRRYFIKRPRYLIEPEEILLDSARQTDPITERMEFAIPEKSVRTFFIFGMIGLVVLLGYSLYLTVFRHEWHLAQAETNRLRLVFEQAPRGIIFDRFGEVLAANKEVFDVAALPLALPRQDKELRIVAERLAAILLLATDEVVEKLKDARQSPHAEPISVWTDISRDAASQLRKDEEKLAGIKLVGRYIRLYPKGPAFSHVLGYTGKITREEIERIPDALMQDIIGRTGVEGAYDSRLRGKRGKEEIEVNAALQMIDMRRVALPEKGESFFLTIDAGFQQMLYETILAHINAHGYERAAAAAVNPKTGEVLALVSIPSFDNNLFAAGMSAREYNLLFRNPAKPLFNRAISGTYGAGSTIKPLIAAAALEEGVVKPDTLINASAGYIAIPNPYDPTRRTIFHDWQKHGIVDIYNAIAWSSNIFFYVIGGGYQEREGLGITKIADYLERFGFGEISGIQIAGESAGLVPNPEWRRITRPHNPHWRLGDTYITAIGQGDVLVTPLQIAMSYAAIANGGNLLQPRIIVEKDSDESSNAAIIRRELGISNENLKVVAEGMRMTTTEGTARSLRVLPFETAGKTGTVQVAGARNHAMFAVYGPTDFPEIALVVIVEEGGERVNTAVPIAREALMWYWENRLKGIQQEDKDI